MKFCFWNLNNRKIGELLYDLVNIYDIDVLVLGESPYLPSLVLTLLNRVKSNFYYSPGIICEKIQIFTKFKSELSIPIEETTRITARDLFSSTYGNINFIAAHYNSKVNWSNEDQAAHSPIFKSLIDSVEKKMGHSRTVICGDFNMNPFDFGMVQSTGLHAVMDKRIAERQVRTIDNIEYKFFYNPMWGFLGDNGKGDVSGTLYYSPAKPINFHWNLFDQVLIRPDLVPDFVDDELEIITRIGKTNLLTKSSLISSKYSDHLPLKFKLNLQ